MLAPLRRVVWFGFAGGLPGGDLLPAIAKNFVRGVGLRTFHLVYSIAEPHPEIFGPSVGTILTYLREKKIDPVIADRLPLKDAVRAHELLESHSTVGKLLLVP